MTNYKIIQKPRIFVIGIECRTVNKPEAAPHDIPKHWDRFYSEDTAKKIPNKLSDDVIALYCDYDGDYTQPYTFVLGHPVQSIDDIPQGMVAKILPAGDYAQFLAIGEHPQTLITTWHNIWDDDKKMKRTYSGDYEVYGPKFFTGSPQEIELFICVRR